MNTNKNRNNIASPAPPAAEDVPKLPPSPANAVGKDEQKNQQNFKSDDGHKFLIVFLANILPKPN
ncbi:MAG: hypothetical protein LH614_22620 [Pyrinomonadaceae bacterium]|nr:hypothetical protein [Pyrinomonadaceae bacterium]